MAIKVQTSESLGGDGNWLKNPGKFHFEIIDTDENPKNFKGEMVDGFRFKLSVLNEGPDKGKEHELTLYNPKLNASEGGIKWARNKQTAALLAAGLASPSQLGGEIDAELSEAMGRQVFAELEYEKDDKGNDKVNEKGNKYLSLVWANIHHVDDPRAKDFPRNQKALDLLPKSLRLDPKVFEAILTKPGESKPAAQPVPAVSSAASDDLGDL